MFIGGVYLNSLLGGLVVSDQSGFFSVELDDGRVVVCRLRGRLMEEAQSSDIAAIGDRVKIQILEDGTGTIEEVAERSGALSRAVRTEGNRGAGQAERQQVIIANADQAIFIFAAAQPNPNFRQLDRFLVAGERAEIRRLTIILNKIDLDPKEKSRQRFDVYRDIGYPVLCTSALQGEGIDELRALLQDRISVFTGPSGVGKSSLLNVLQPGLERQVKQVSESSQEGMHTTRDSRLIKLDCGGYLADTPGVRNLNIWDVEPEELDGYFIEIADHVSQCRFNDCTHLSEPGCAVRAAVDKGDISKLRYDSYLSLRAEIDAAYATY
jgi:ribosome biogenesis GTPase